ncbi:lipopolysaccharide biosynthesis protein [Virgisporangium ochraceum]|uniref:lipopolysaccharide biosynthesis protein n=1 Tax=Virgisporangium ochraceum TaxID=65505 RepID=UPI001EF349E3|nr:polysaccharide biosynthesis C-terminal domain-containing protein [Virgisporangium ochraceum]
MAVLASPRQSVDRAADRAALLRGAGRGGVLNLIGAAVAGAAGFGATWLVARGLGDPGRAGAFLTALAGFTLAAGVARLGTQTSLVYWPARLRALGARQELERCLQHGIAPVAVAGAVAGFALGFAASWMPPEMAGPLRVFAVFLPLAVLTDALLAAARGYRALRPTVVLERLFRPFLQLAALGAVVLVGAGGSAVFAAAWAAPYLPVVLLAGYTLGRVHAMDTSASGTEAFTPRAYWTFTGPRAVASVAQLALQRVDVLLLAALGGLPAAGLYAVAGKYVVLSQVAGGGLSQAVQPRLAERLAVEDVDGVRALYQQATAWLILATWPLHLAVAFNATVYLGLFGPSYRDGAAVVWILAGAMLVATGCGMVDMVLAMGGRTRWNLYNVLAALATMVVLDIVVIPWWGAVGAALGLAAAVLVNNLVPLTQIWWTLGVHPFGRPTLNAAALTASTCGVPPLLATAAGAGPAAVTATSAAGALCYLAGAYRMRRRLNLHLLRGKS